MTLLVWKCNQGRRFPNIHGGPHGCARRCIMIVSWQTAIERPSHIILQISDRTPASPWHPSQTWWPKKKKSTKKKTNCNLELWQEGVCVGSSSEFSAWEPIVTSRFLWNLQFRIMVITGVYFRTPLQSTNLTLTWPSNLALLCVHSDTKTSSSAGTDMFRETNVTFWKMCSGFWERKVPVRVYSLLSHGAAHLREGRAGHGGIQWTRTAVDQFWGKRLKE